MFRTYLKTTVRNFTRNKGYSLLNIFGLAIGIVCTGLIFLWVEDEMNYDNSYAKRDQLYYVRVNQQYDAYVFTHGSTPGLLGPVMKQEMPGLADVCRTTEGQTRGLFSIDDKSVYASGKYADPAIFNMFSLTFVQGNAASAFRQLYSVVLTESAVKKIFGNEKNVIGKTVSMDHKQDYTVSGVLRDFPTNSTMQFEWVAPFDIFFQDNPWAKEWGNSGVSTYAELRPGVAAATIDKQLYDFIRKRDPASISHPFLFGMRNWHLRDQFNNGKLTGGGRIEYVRLFSVIAWIILLIACINFMNLSTARSSNRAREVGVRKVLGAGKKGLVMQFIGEALLMSLLAAIVAVVIMSLVLPMFNTVVQKDLFLGLGNPIHLGALFLITVICGLVAGSYPSFFLSSFNPVFVLKGIKLKSGGVVWVRKGLVILQFTVSIVLIVSTIIIYQQIQHVKGRNLGFNKNGLLQVNVERQMGSNYELIRQDLMNTGLVENVALTDHAILDGGNNTDRLTWPGKAAGSKVLVSGRSVTPSFFDTYKLKILSGRGLQESDSMQKAATGSTMGIVITQSLERLMGNKSAIGQVLFNEGDPSNRLTVVGVVNDFVYGYMYGQSDPVIFTTLPYRDATLLHTRFKQVVGPAQGIAAVQAVMKKDNPAYPMQFEFVDDQFSQIFSDEALISKLSRVFAALAIIISCLGLLGLAAYTAERRTKEIGIRKVLGASVSGLTGLLTMEFLQLVFISCIIAFPTGWLIMHDWLSDYPYRISISWFVFIFAGGAALIIAWLAVSVQTIKAALANPVNSLRAE
ncbi:MAG TPA: ABC transporter permease [Chitinophagaceae bacterium]|nr:ABC transporter permease [Chitinophagaceae bacterium]